MFFVVPEGQNKRIVPKQDLDDIETFLNQSAKQKNPNLLNIQKTKNLPDWSIAGVVRSSKGKAGKENSVFKKLMGLKDC